MSNFFYLDRPAVPPTQQVNVNLPAITEEGVHVESLATTFSAYAMEVKNEDSNIVGTLLYYPGVAYESLVSDFTFADGVDVDDEHTAGLVPYEFDGEVFNAEADVADLLEDYEDVKDGIYSEDLVASLARKIVSLQKRNNNQYNMIVNLQSQQEEDYADELDEGLAEEREMVDEDGLDAK